MITFWTKSILALVLAALAVIGFFAILELLGKKEKRFNPKVLRAVHRINGYFFLFLFLLLSYYCLAIMRVSGQELSPRGALHGLLAAAVFFLLCLKILILRFYRQYFSMVVPIGMSIFHLTMGMTALSAGYYFTMHGGVAPVTQGGREETDAERLVGRGEGLFLNHCADCHYADKEEIRIGPGLKGILKKERLPVSNRPATDANVRAQIRSPYKGMPAFPDLSEAEMSALMAYLGSL